jgi:hypothetical protein
LEKVVYRQADESDRQDDRGAEYFFLHASLGGIGATGLSERAAQSAAAALLQKHQADDGRGNYDLNDGDNISHKIEFNIAMINVAASNAASPVIFSSGIKASASQTIDISITKLNKFKVKIRRGRDNNFKIRAIAKLSKAIQNPAKSKTPHGPLNPILGISWTAA